MDGDKCLKKNVPLDSKTHFSKAGDFVEADEDVDKCLDPKLYAMDEYRRLPQIVKRRVRALKKLQYETIKLDAQFYRELFDLEIKYDSAHQDILAKRQEIITGLREPTDDDCDWPEDDEVDCLTDTVKEKVTVSSEDMLIKENSTPDIKGVPDFWLKTMQNISLLNDMIQEHDIDILRHLNDVKCKLVSGEEPGFILEFHFSPNVYFTDSVLTKQYYFNYEIPSDQPFEYEGPEIVRAKGCTINWNPGKNVTVKLIKKVQKRKGCGAKRTITKTVQEDSFFNFFQPPSQTLSEDLVEDAEILLEADFKIGQFFRESLIPRAVLYFTGEAIDSELDEDEDDDEDDDSEDDDEDIEEEKETTHHSSRRTHQKLPQTGKGGEQSECKQQ